MAVAFSRRLFLNASTAKEATIPLLLRLYRSFSSSDAVPGTKTPPRKGRQAVRRFLKLLNPDTSAAPRVPSVARAVTALAESPESISSANAATLVSAADNPLLAFDFYRFLRASASFRPEPDIFVALLRCQLLSISPVVFRIRYYLEEMRKRGLRISPADLRVLVGPLLPAKTSLVRQFVEEVDDVFGLDARLLTELVALYGENGLVEEVTAVAEKARAGGTLDPDLYCSLIGSYSAAGEAKSAMKVFVEMRDRELSVSLAAYTDLLRVLLCAGWLRLCSAVLEEMVKRHGGLVVEERLGVDLMRAFAEKGMIAEAGLFKNGVLEGKKASSSIGGGR